MYDKKVDPQGLSLESNLVSLPEMESLEEIFTTPPEGYAPGFIAEVRSEGLRAVLVQNGNNVIRKNRMVEGRQANLSDSTLSVTPKGSMSIDISTTASADSLYKDRFKGGYLYIYVGKGVKKNGAYRKLLLAGNEVGDGTGPTKKFYLATPLPVGLDTTTHVYIVDSVFRFAQEGTLTRQKALGIPLIDIPTWKYFWAIFEGRTLGIAGDTIADTVRGTQLLKAATGRLGLKNAIADIVDETVGKSVFTFARSANDLILVDLFIQGIRQRTAN